MGDNERRTVVNVEQVGFGGLWFIGWLFTIGFAELELVQALIGLLAWPYYLGVALR